MQINNILSGSLNMHGPTCRKDKEIVLAAVATNRQVAEIRRIKRAVELLGV